MSGADPGISNGGGGRSRRGRILRSIRFALMPLHTYPMFLFEE